MRGDTAAALGLWGEEQVAAYIKDLGGAIVETRWRCRFGELDLVAQRGEYLCFVEVKLRKSDAFAPARAFVTGSKQQKLKVAAEWYLAQHPTSLQPRFDVAEVYAPLGRGTSQPEIIYWENAF
ncbi:MAG: hypothetical protein H6Q61_1033 [Firmicutes bacterium]|nr:hypothetical protein [Bacillota bacterium]